MSRFVRNDLVYDDLRKTRLAPAPAW